jgi:DNA polymerase-1
MRHATFDDVQRKSYPLCVLMPQIQKSAIEQHYIYPHGLDAKEVLALTLHQGAGKKTPASEIKSYILEELVPVLQDMQVEYLLVTDSDYFKALTKSAKVEVHLGYVLDCVFGPWKVVYLPSHRAIFYDPEKVKSKIAMAVQAVIEHRLGNYEAPGAAIIKFAAYPIAVEEIEQWLERLIVEDRPLTCDIECFSLKHPTAGIGTITFCWNKHEGISFPVDLGPDPTRVRALLKSFFLRFKSKLIYHRIAFDVYVLIYQLFMKDILDTKGLLQGLEVMLRDWDCTRLIAYLALNSCAGNQLGLKVLAQEFAGNYAVDEIEDITQIPLPELLQYNLVDGLSTWYVWDKYHPVMLADQQEDIYVNLFQPATVDIIQMQLTGLPVSQEQVALVKPALEAIEQKAVAAINSSPLVQRYVYRLEEQHIAKRNAKMVKKRIVLGDEPQEFNPRSAPQLQDLLYEFIGLPVIALSDSRLPSTKGKVLADLRNHTQDQDVKDLLTALVDYKAVIKILTDFIPSMEAAAEGPDGWHYLFGNFNLGGTISGRLSSSDPNLQNLPANVYMDISQDLVDQFPVLAPYIKKGKLALGKLIKSCFKAPPGWIFAGLDFASLEDRISALTTKDPNKLKVYTDGFDGHCLRAQSYFAEDMPDIDPNSVESINSIEKKYPDHRQKSKTPTFALTYDGTVNTLMTGSGFDRATAQRIFDRYHELYAVSRQWVQAKLDQASNDGFITGAFGLRVRTPLLKQVIRGTKKTPYEAEAEGRSAGNALGQSWCLLNSRASVEFMGKVRISPYRTDIRPCAQIHDAQYYLIRDWIEPVAYTNKHLVDATYWQNHPEIAHDEVGLGGELSIFHPSWAEEITIPNGAGPKEIIEVIHAHI